MTPEQLREMQSPIKEHYRKEPDAARIKFHSEGVLRPNDLICEVNTSHGVVASGLHPAAGGEPGTACSGDMLLDALVACAGVTLNVVATAMGISLRGGRIRAVGEADFRGTLGIDRAAPIGLTKVDLQFELESDAPADQLDKLIQLTERYCVIMRTLQQSPNITISR